MTKKANTSKLLCNPAKQAHKAIENRPKHSNYIKKQVNKDKTESNKEANESFNDKKNRFQNISVDRFVIKPTEHRNKTFIRINRKMKPTKNI